MPDETIAIIHGFGGHRLLMSPLAKRFRQAGMRVENWGYHSFLSDIETHAQKFLVELRRLHDEDVIESLHIVAHSMGCLITRQALLDAKLPKLKRIVLLCPPNRGSHIAAKWSRYFGWFSRTFAQLSDRPDGFARRLPATLCENYEVGILAASSDFVVAQESVALPYAKETRIIQGFHTAMLFSSETADLTKNFIRGGSFDYSLSPIPVSDS